MFEHTDDTFNERALLVIQGHLLDDAFQMTTFTQRNNSPSKLCNIVEMEESTGHQQETEEYGDEEINALLLLMPDSIIHSCPNWSRDSVEYLLYAIKRHGKNWDAMIREAASYRGVHNMYRISDIKAKVMDIYRWALESVEGC